MTMFLVEATRMDRRTAQVEPFGHKVGEPRWPGHVQKRDYGYTGQKMLKMELPGRRKKGRSQRGFMEGSCSEIGGQKSMLGTG